MKEIVIGLEIPNDKSRKKVLKTAADVQGVVSMALGQDQLVVTGDVDAFRLTTSLRKKFPNATLQSVEDLNVNDEDAAVEEEAVVEEQEKETKREQGLPVCYCNHYYHASPSYQVVVYDLNPNTRSDQWLTPWS